MSRSLRSGFRHRAGRAAAVVGAVAAIAFVSAPAVASAVPNPLVGSTFSISSPGSLSGTSGQPITPVQFVASHVDVSTAPATTSIRWVPEQLPNGLTLSGTGLLSGTLKAAIPRGVYDLQVKAIETVTTELNGKQRIDSRKVRFDTSISISGPSVTSSDPTAIGSGFSGPSGVAVDSSGHVFVADTDHNRVVKMDADGSNLTTIATGFSRPAGVAVDSSGHVFVADTLHSLVVKMDSDGSNQTVIGSGFRYPAGVAVDSSGTVFVSDSGNNRVVKMDADGSNRTVIGSGFNYPAGVAVDSSGTVFVSDSGNDRVVKMNSDGSNLITIASGLQYPYGLTVDSSVHVFVAESNNHRVVKMNADGSNQTDIVYGSAPSGVAVDSSGAVFVSDFGNTKIIAVPSNASFNIPDQILPEAFAGSGLSTTLLAVDKVDPSTSPRVTSVRWSASSLPAGLWLSSSGELRGRPRPTLQGGYYPIYVTATESVKTKIGGVLTVTTKTVSRKLSLYVYPFGF